MLIKEPWLIQNTDFLQNNIYKKNNIWDPVNNRWDQYVFTLRLRYPGHSCHLIISYHCCFKPFDQPCLISLSFMFSTTWKKSIFLFSSSCCRPLGFWLSRAQSLLYCSEHGAPGFFSEEVKSCICPAEHPTCQGVIPCSVGTLSTSCSACATDNATRCGACHHGNMLHLGSCRPSIAASLDHYLSFDLDMPDAEVLTHASICKPSSVVFSCKKQQEHYYWQQRRLNVTLYLGSLRRLLLVYFFVTLEFIKHQTSKVSKTNIINTACKRKYYLYRCAI